MPAMHSVVPANFIANFSRRNQANDQEKNVASAILSALVVVLLILALALPNWYYLKGGGCSHQTNEVKNSHFPHFIQHREHSKLRENISFTSLSYYGFNEDLEKCLTDEIITLQRIIFGLCLLTIIFSFKQFLTDILGSRSALIDCSRRCGFGNIISVMLIVVIIGLCYYATDLIEHQQEIHQFYTSSKVEVNFGISYYLIASAGVVGVFATAASLFRCDHLLGNSDTTMLLDDHQEETFSIALPHSYSWSYIHNQSNDCVNNLPPPPPYTP